MKEFIQKCIDDCDLQINNISNVARKLSQYHGECINIILEKTDQLNSLYTQRDIITSERHKFYTEKHNFTLTKSEKEIYYKGEMKYTNVNDSIKKLENDLAAIENLIKYFAGIRDDIRNINNYESKIRG